jgi:uncharacterized protein YhhL (DUF1145 family)
MRRSRPRPHCRARAEQPEGERASAPHVAGGARQQGSHACHGLPCPERLGFRQGGGMDRRIRIYAAPLALYRPLPRMCSIRRTHSLLCIACVFILCVHVSTIVVIITQRKAHGLQDVPEALAVLLPRALNDAVTHT